MNEKKSVNSFCLDNLKGLIDTKKSRTEIAAALGCDVSTIAKHYNGSRDVTTEYVLKYAKYFNVSTDYIFGLTNHKTALDSEEGEIIRAACDYTGLNENSVSMLYNSERDRKVFQIISDTIYIYSLSDMINLMFSDDIFSKNFCSNFLNYLDEERNKERFYYMYREGNVPLGVDLTNLFLMGMQQEIKSFKDRFLKNKYQSGGADNGNNTETE